MADSSNPTQTPPPELPATERRTSLILGIPVDDLTMEEATERIFGLVESFGPETRPHLVATINVDFLVNCLSTFGGFRHPELVGVLRKAVICTADGMPLVWASRLLGCGLRERVTGADLVPELCRVAALRGRSVFLLGGKLETAQEAADLLRKRCPGLKVAGVDSPFVHTQGEELVDAEETDIPICERLNASGADILFIGFGNPKQELWFQRNQHRLRVPVSLGIGGTFSFITGQVKRAPEWMQRWGLEWLFRLVVEPRRLWKRYFLGFIKFGSAVGAAIAYHWLLKLSGSGRTGKPIDAEERLYLSARRTLRLVRPARRLADALPGLFAILDEEPVPDCVVIDFSRVAMLTISELGSLMHFCRDADEKGCSWLLTFVGKRARRVMKMNRVLDFFEDRICVTPRHVVDRLSLAWNEALCMFSIDMGEETTVVGFWGALEATQLAELDANSIVDALGPGGCVVDLSYCHFLDSSGLGFLLKIARRQKQQEQRFTLRGVGPEIRRVLRISRVQKLFEIE